MSAHILTAGGFNKIPLDLSEKSDQKIRLYYLESPTQAKVIKAKAALLKELEKGYTYEGLDKFESEITKKPYLLKEGKTLQLFEGEETTTEKRTIHQIQVSQKSNYKFLQTVAVGGDFNVSGKSTVVFNIAADSLQRTSLARVRRSLEQFYQGQDRYIKRKVTLGRKEAPPTPIESFINMPIAQWSRQVGIEKEILSNSEGRSAEQIFYSGEKSTIFPENILKLKKDDRPLYVLILGRPGVGKSTLSQYCGWLWWSSQGEWKEDFDLVFKIDLGKLPLSQSGEQSMLEELLFDEFFKHQNASPLQSSKELECLLRSIPPERILFLLDGYDEFPSNSLYRRAIDQRLLNNQRYYHVVLTSRSSKQPSHKNFDAVLECTGFSSENILTYLQIFKPQKATEIWAYIKANPALHTLAHVPLLLEMILETWEELLKKLKTAALTNTELYETMHTKMCIASAEKQRARFPGITEEQVNRKIEQAEVFTAELAFRVMESNNTLFGQDILHATKQHCRFYDIDPLLEPGFIHGHSPSHEYYFPHLTLQEHWAAKHLAQALLDNQENKVIFHDKKWITVKEFIACSKYNPRYIQVWEFVAGILGRYAEDSEIRAGNKEPLRRFLMYMLKEKPPDLLNLYQLRFINLLNEASVYEGLEEVNGLFALYETYFEAQLSGNLKLKLHNSHPVWRMLITGCPMRDDIFEKLISTLGTLNDHGALAMLTGIIAVGKTFSLKALQLLGEALIQDENEIKSHRVAIVLTDLAKTTHHFPEKIKSYLKKFLTKNNHPLQLSAIATVARLANSSQMDSAEIAYSLLSLLENPSEQVKQAVGFALEEMAQSGKLPLLTPEDLRKIVANKGFQVLLVLAKANLTFPPDVLEAVVSQATLLTHVIKDGRDVEANILKTIVQANKQLPDQMVERMIQSKSVESAELLKNLAKAGLILSKIHMEQVCNNALDSQHNGSVRLYLIEALEETVKNGERLPSTFIQTLINQILIAAPADTHGASFYDDLFLEKVLKAGQLIEDGEIDRLSKILEGGEEPKRAGAAHILEVITRAKKLPKKTICILKKALKENPTHVLVSVILSLTAQAEEVTGDDLPSILSLIGNRFIHESRSHEPELCVFRLLHKLLEKRLSFPPGLNIVEKLQEVLLQDNDTFRLSSAASLLSKLYTIPMYASSAKNVLQAVIKTSCEKSLQDDFRVYSQALSVLKSVAEIEPNFPKETIEALESLLHKESFICGEALKILWLIANAGRELPNSLTLALGKKLSEKDEVQYFKDALLAAIKTSFEKTLQDDFRACSQPLSVLKRIAEIEPNFPQEAIEALESLLHKDSFIYGEAVKMLELMVRVGRELSNSLTLALGKKLSEDTVQYLAAIGLDSITAHGQQLSDETLKALLLFILQSKPGRNWPITGQLFNSSRPALLAIEGQMSTFSGPALSAIGNVSSALPDWVDPFVAEMLKKDDEFIRFNALRILEEIASNRKSLSSQTIQLLLHTAAREGKDKFGSPAPAAYVLGTLDLSNELKLVRESNLALDILIDVLAKTPLKAIVEAKILTPQEVGWLLASRLIKQQTALFLNGTKLSFFEGNNLYEILLNQEEISELLPYIRVAASSQIGINVNVPGLTEAQTITTTTSTTFTTLTTTTALNMAQQQQASLPSSFFSSNKGGY